MQLRGNPFNPRTREECDYKFKIHSLPPSYFNPRTREECDSNGTKMKERWETISIHALARSATTLPIAMPRPDEYFNPRTREECDPYIALLAKDIGISIHALARSATCN